MVKSYNPETFIDLSMEVYGFFKENRAGVSMVTIGALSKYLTLVNKTHINSLLTEYLVKRVMKDIISKDGEVLCKDESLVRANLSHMIPLKMRFLDRYTKDMKPLKLSDSLSDVIDLTILHHLKELSASRVVRYYIASEFQDDYERLKVTKMILGNELFMEILKVHDTSNLSEDLLEEVKQGSLESKTLVIEEAIKVIIELLEYLTRQPLGRLGTENALVRVAYFMSVYCGRFIRESFIYNIIKRLDGILWHYSMESNWGEKTHYLHAKQEGRSKERINNSVSLILQGMEWDKPEVFKDTIGNPAILDVLSFCNLLDVKTDVLQYTFHFATEKLINVDGPFDEDVFCKAIYKLVNSWSLTSFIWSMYLERYAYYHPEVNFGAGKNEVYEKISNRKALCEEYKLSSRPNLLKEIEDIDKEYAAPFVLLLKQQVAQYGVMADSSSDWNVPYHLIRIRVPDLIDQAEASELMLILDRYGFKDNRLKLHNPSRQIDIEYLNRNFYGTKLFLEDHNVIIHDSNMKTQSFDCTLSVQTFNVLSRKKQWKRDDRGKIYIDLSECLGEN